MLFAPAFSGLPNLFVEVGGPGKRINAALYEMQKYPLPPSFLAIVVTCVRKKWRWYLNANERFDTLGDLLNAVPENVPGT